jgi:hypothetical protein
VEGPYRDLGAGFARLTGVEGARRGPSRISHVEDALTELLRNARDAGANNVFVASTLARRRFRTLTVIDDGRGIPDPYADLVFEPGVTTRHLDPVLDPADNTAPHGAGLALYQIRSAALTAEVVSPSSPTAVRTTFDTETVPERALQSASRTSRTNLRAAVQAFVRNLPPGRDLRAHYGPPANILAALLYNHIIQHERNAGGLMEASDRVGVGVSLRTAQRILRGDISPSTPVGPVVSERRAAVKRRPVGDGGPVLPLGDEERAAVADILGRAARSGYLEIEDLRFEVRPGEISVKARVYEPEDEYE